MHIENVSKDHILQNVTFIKSLQSSMVLTLILVIAFEVSDDTPNLYSEIRSFQSFIPFLNIFWCGYLYFPYFQMKQNWVQESILAQLWPHFHLLSRLRWESNPQPFDGELSLLTTRLVWRTLFHFFISSLECYIYSVLY